MVLGTMAFGVTELLRGEAKLLFLDAKKSSKTYGKMFAGK